MSKIFLTLRKSMSSMCKGFFDLHSKLTLALINYVDDYNYSKPSSNAGVTFREIALREVNFLWEKGGSGTSIGDYPTKIKKNMIFSNQLTRFQLPVTCQQN